MRDPEMTDADWDAADAYAEYADQFAEDAQEREQARYDEMDWNDSQGYGVRSAHCWL